MIEECPECAGLRFLTTETDDDSENPNSEKDS